MTNISRRTLLKGLGVGALGLAAADLTNFTAGFRVAQAQGAASPSAFLRRQVGDFEVTTIQDGFGQFESGIFGVNAPEGAIDELLAANNLPTGTVNNTFNVSIVNTGDRLVLLDTGLGGNLIPTLGLLGIDPADVTDVIITHWHPDHIGAVAGASGPNFPNAAHYISQIELDLIVAGPTGSPLDQSITSAGAAFSALIESGQVTGYADEQEIVPGIQAVASVGHTPGHHSLLVASGSSQLMFIGDAFTQFVVSLAHPEWHMGFDADGEQAAASRRALLERLASEQIQLAAYHFPFPGTGYVVADGEGFRFLAAI